VSSLLSATYYATSAKGPVLQQNQSVHTVVPSSLVLPLEIHILHRENVKAEKNLLIDSPGFKNDNKSRAIEVSGTFII
jgi:hypothetical protein